MLRGVEPLSAKQWAWLEKRRVEGPTKEEIEKMNEIRERVQRIAKLAKI